MLNSGAFQQQAYGQYQRSQVETATPGQLVVLLYQGCLRFTQRGKAALESGDYETARVSLLRAQDVVAELMSGLNLEAGEIADNLLRLYEYLYRRLVQANVKRDVAAAGEVEGLVRALLPAWEEAVRKHPAAGIPAPAPAIPGRSVSLAG